MICDDFYLSPDRMHFAAPENTAKAQPFESGETIPSPVTGYELQRNPISTASFLLKVFNSVSIQCFLKYRTPIRPYRQ
jgi:hypothetical protein